MAQNLRPHSWNSFFLTYLLVQEMSRKLEPKSWKKISTNTLRKAEDLMPRDIVSSEPRHWMVFGNWPNTCLGSDDTNVLQVFCFLRVEETDVWKSEVWICLFWIKFMNIMEFGLKWVHTARYELILKLDGALWLTIVSKPLPTPKGLWKVQKIQKNPKSQFGTYSPTLGG